MATERVTITVESNIGEDGPLTVMDTLDQFKDAFELLSAAIAQEAGGENVRWRLERLSKNSPATVTAVAYSADPDVTVSPMVHRGKMRFSRDMEALRQGDVSPWLRSKAQVAKKMLARNLNGIGKTTFSLDDEEPITVLVEKSARAGLKALQRAEINADSEDRSRSEYGSIDANVSRTDTWFGRPALYVVERLTGRQFHIVLSEELAARAGPSHSWTDAWSEKRIRVKGRIYYDKEGSISRVSAVEMEDVNPVPVDLQSLRKADILGGKSPVEHLNDLWGYADD
ncbi:hypothetical protein AAG594_14230 [Citromicrobium bathyomarinum]